MIEKLCKEQCTFSLCVLIVTALSSSPQVACSQEQDTTGQQVLQLPTVEAVASAWEMNSRKFPNFSVRSVAAKLASPGFYPVPETQIPENFLVQSKIVEIVSCLGIVEDQRKFLDMRTAKISTQRPVINHVKYWSYPQRGLAYRMEARTEILNVAGQIAPTNDGLEVVHEVNPTRFVLPFIDLAYLQMAAGEEKSPLRTLKARVVKWETYKGLRCVRIEWSQDTAEMQLSGYALYAPSRDYKVVLRQEVLRYLNNPQLKQSTETTTVENFRKIDNAWLPSQVRSEVKNVAADNSEKSLIEKYRLVDFKPDVATVDILFDPLFSPGTSIYHLGPNAPLEIAGGDTSALVGQFQTGDFSALEKQEVEDLSKP